VGQAQIEGDNNKVRSRDNADREQSSDRQTQAAQSLNSADTSFIFQTSLVTDTLDEVQEDMHINLDMPEWMAGTALFSSVGMSAGYILWSLRGGYMIASLLSAMPAWTLVDPLPVLEYLDREDDSDNESLQSILDN